MKILKQIAEIVTAPYRAGVAFVDDHPTASQIKAHVSAVTPQITTEGTKLQVVAEYVDAPGLPPRLLEEIDTADKGADIDECLSFMSGYKLGYSICQGEILLIKRSDVSAQLRAVRESRHSRPVPTYTPELSVAAPPSCA